MENKSKKVLNEAKVSYNKNYTNLLHYENSNALIIVVICV